MHISLFGDKLARLLADYLDKNKTTLDSSLTEDTLQQARSLLSSGMSSGLRYLWGSPSSNTLSRSPQAIQLKSSGKAGLLKACKIANMFGLVYSQSGLNDALSARSKIGDNSSRKNDLITEAFALNKTHRVTAYKMHPSDYDAIMTYVSEKDSELRSDTLGNLVMTLLTQTLDITAEEIRQEIFSNSNLNSSYSAQQGYSADEDIPASLQPSKDVNPEDLALRRAIYLKAQLRKLKAHNNNEWAALNTQPSVFPNSARSSSSTYSYSGSPSSWSSPNNSTHGSTIFDFSPPSSNESSPTAKYK